MTKAKILVAKSQSKTTLQIKARLGRLGYQVTGTPSTPPAIFKNIARRKPDLVLLDLGIKDGDQSIGIAREIESGFHIPVLFLDDRNRTKAQSPSSTSDAFDYVPRPFRSHELHTAIEMAIYKHSLPKQPQQPDQLLEKNASENSLRHSSQLFSRAFHASPSGMIVSRLSDGEILDANQSYERLLGYSMEELRGSNGLALGIYRESAERRQIVELLQRDGFVHDYEAILYSKSGEQKWVLFSLELMELEGRRCILANMFDITERKRAEAALQARERYLALLNNMTKTILLSTDLESTLNVLAVDMARLLNADHCHITRWDSDLNRLVSEFEPGSGEHNMTASVMQAGHALAAGDVQHSPLLDPRSLTDRHIHSMLGIPLIAGEHKLGAALITFHKPHHFTQEEVSQAEQAGNQIAMALRNFQQSTEIEQRLKESSALAEIGRALSRTERVGTGKVLQLIVDSARDLIPQAEESVIHLLESEEKILIAQAVSGFGDRDWARERIKMRLGEGVAGRVIGEGVTINVRDVQNDPNFIFHNSYPPEFRSLLVAPVQSGGQQTGTISVQSRNVNAFSGKDEALLNALGVQAAIAIENTHLFESIQQHLREVDALYQTGQRLASSLDADELIEDVVALLKQIFSYYHAQIFLLDPVNHDLVLKNASGKVGEQLLQGEFRLPRGTGIVGHVAETGQPFVTNDVNNVVFFYRNPLLPDTQSELTVPIKVEGNVVGLLDIQDTPPHRLTESDLQVMVAVADQLAVALQKAHLHSDLQTALQQEQTIRSQLVQSERLALVGRLLASVSHELNNPLQAIQNALFLLKDETNLSGQAGQDLDIILSETERMAALIERLRSAYRPIRMTDFQPVSLNLLIEDVYMLMSTHMRHREIVFEFFPEPDLPPVSGISDQLRQVVLNLFLNAVEVMKPGGRLSVQTCSLPDQKEVLLTVKDSGSGIDPEILPRIFDPFITTKLTGTGLGLTITHDIVEQHHGRILAENHAEGGAIFSVWLATHEDTA
jgi:PAS domain S-box-containing protein